MMKLKPLGKKVLITPDPIIEKTTGGIILAEIAQRRDPQGVVCGVGSDVTLVKEGDHVVFGKYAGYDLGIDDVLVDEDDVHCVIMED